MKRAVTKIDNSGRISLPTEYRTFLNVVIGDYVQINDENGKVVITKFTG
jgi:bifunctional DNA-binding transcriptional regulator/antitoxin component of YhaV-PrlF toxin-antitoxin module